MNKVTLKSRATLLGKVFAAKGVTLTRAEQLTLAAQLEGARDWHHASGEAAPAQDTPVKFNALQLEAARAYSSGDYRHHTEMDESLAFSDRLFAFVIQEVGEAGQDVEEAARVIQQASDELAEVAAHLGSLDASALEAVIPGVHSSTPTARVTNGAGVESRWSYEFMSDRFGKPLVVKARAPHLQAVVENDRQTFDAIWSICLEECAFVAEVNGRLGALYEIEIETAEADRPCDSIALCTVSENDRRIQLQRDIVDLEKQYPTVQWAVVEPGAVALNRMGVWGFIPHGEGFTKAQAKSVLEDLYKKFY